MSKRLITPAAITAALVWLFAILATSSPAHEIVASNLCATIQTHNAKALAYAGMGFPSSSAFATSDYLPLVTENGECRWDKADLPVRVYISDGAGTPGYRSNFRGMIVDAFNEWCRVLGNKVSWTEVSSPAGATIVVRWTADTQMKGNGAEAGQTKAMIERDKYTGDRFIRGAQISILTALFGRPFNDFDMNKICLHEVGHSLGLQGHSDNPNDIMYPSVNEAQSADLTARDTNTMVRLYQTAGTSTIARGPVAGQVNGMASNRVRNFSRRNQGAMPAPDYMAEQAPQLGYGAPQMDDSQPPAMLMTPDGRAFVIGGLGGNMDGGRNQQAAMRRLAWQMARRQMLMQQPQSFGGYEGYDPYAR